MILSVHELLRTHLQNVLGTLYSLTPEAVPAIVLEYPPNRQLGDLGTPVAIEVDEIDGRVHGEMIAGVGLTLGSEKVRNSRFENSN